MTQTAVEWLEDRILKPPFNIVKVFEQAKEMEKQQIIDAYETSHISMMNAEQYYNEKFNK